MKDPIYPWREHFPVLDADYKNWKTDKNGDSLLFHALQKNLIDRGKYFNWATERYQIPFLKNDFFEYAVMGKAQWDRTGDLREWSREVLPVWEWENVVYVGCMEPPEDEKNWTFPHRLLLVTDLALKMCWTAGQRFFHLTAKGDTKGTRPAGGAGEEKRSLSFPSPPLEAPAGATSSRIAPAKAAVPLAISSIPPSAAPSAKGSLPEETVAPPSLDPTGEPVRETSPSPEPESPQRDNIIPLNLSPPPSPSVESPAKTPKAAVLESSIIKLSGEDGFSQLQEKLKKDFAGILLLKNRDSLLYPEKWAGRIQIEDLSKSLISLKTISSFSVLLKGFDYHGFVVENESNVKFFQDISWPVLPKHITAVPFFGPDQKLDRVFLGVAVKSLSHKKLEDIKNTVLPFFEKTAQKQAA